MSDRLAGNSAQPIIQPQPHLKSMGEITVLEYPEVYWNTVFIDGKFYIAHPL